jgi:hypothetical protein
MVRGVHGHGAVFDVDVSGDPLNGGKGTPRLRPRYGEAVQLPRRAPSLHR